MKKRVKVFREGNFKQGKFSKEDVKNIFGNIKNKVEGIYIHSSKWKEEGKEPIICCEFSNFSEENGIAYADAEFNEKGKSYYDDGVIKGISVEIKNGLLDKIALLPLGVNPAIAGAEFEEKLELSESIEFEEIKEGEIVVTLEEILKALEGLTLEDRLALIKKIGEMITPEQKKAFRAVAYEFQQAVEEETVAKTEEEIRAELRLEFEADRKKEKELMEFSVMVEKKVLPADRFVQIEAFKASQNSDTVIEFSETEKCTTKDKLLSDLKKRADIDLTKEFAAAPLEFSKQETESKKRLEEIKKTSEETRNMMGGKR